MQDVEIGVLHDAPEETLIGGENNGCQHAGCRMQRGEPSIAENAGEDGAVVMNKVLENKETNYGYDARLDRYCDMVKEGIIDPTKVVRSALQNAASVSTLLLTSDALVTDAPTKDEKKKAAGGGGGYDDMY